MSSCLMFQTYLLGFTLVNEKLPILHGTPVYVVVVVVVVVVSVSFSYHCPHTNIP